MLADNMLLLLNLTTFNSYYTMLQYLA